MTGGDCQHLVCITGIYCHRCQRERLPAGRTGTIKTKKRNFQFLHAKGCGDELPQQITCKNIADTLRHLPCFLQNQLCRFYLQHTLRFFPVLLTEHRIFTDQIKQVSKRSLAFFFSYYRSTAPDIRWFFKADALFSCHTIHILIPAFSRFYSMNSMAFFPAEYAGSFLTFHM